MPSTTLETNVKTIPVLIAAAFALAACATAGRYVPASNTSAYWSGSSSSVETFRHDNVVCSARASRFGNVAAAPDNRMDRPMQRWPNQTAQETYESCMGEMGWHAAG